MLLRVICCGDATDLIRYLSSLLSSIMSLIRLQIFWAVISLCGPAAVLSFFFFSPLQSCACVSVDSHCCTAVYSCFAPLLQLSGHARQKPATSSSLLSLCCSSEMSTREQERCALIHNTHTLPPCFEPQRFPRGYLATFFSIFFFFFSSSSLILSR